MNTPHTRHAPDAAPGGRAALARGCTCSVLANAAFRAGSDQVLPLVEPDCPVHRDQTGPATPPPARFGSRFAASDHNSFDPVEHEQTGPAQTGHGDMDPGPS